MSFEDMKEKAGEIVDGIKDKFEDGKDAVEEKADKSGVADKVEGKLDQAKGSIQEKVGDLKS